MRSQAERGTPSPCGPVLLSQWHWAAHSPVPSRDRAALPPHLAAQPCSTGETRAGGSQLLPAPPKGRAVPAAPALVLKKKKIPIKYPPQLSSHTDIAAGENESRQPPTHPSRASQARPPPYPLLYTPLAPFTPFTCHRGKASLRKSAQGERSPAHHTKTHRGGHTALPKNQQQLEELVAGAAESPLERPVSILRQNHRFYQLPSARCSCAVAAAQAARGEAGWPRPAGREGEQRASGSSHGDFPAPLAFRQKKSSSTRGWSPQRGRAVPHGPHEPLEGTSKQGDESQGPRAPQPGAGAGLGEDRLLPAPWDPPQLMAPPVSSSRGPPWVPHLPAGNISPVLLQPLHTKAFLGTKQQPEREANEPCWIWCLINHFSGPALGYDGRG